MDGPAEEGDSITLLGELGMTCLDCMPYPVIVCLNYPVIVCLIL